MKDKETGMILEEETALPVKKFVTITVEGKCVLVYLLNAFFKECLSFFEHCKYSFPDNLTLLVKELIIFSKLHFENSIVAFICMMVEIYQPDTVTKSGYNNMERKISEKARAFFRNTEEQTASDIQVTHLCSLFMKFINTMAIVSTDILHEKRQAVNMSFMCSILRILSSARSDKFEYADCKGLKESIYVNIKEFILEEVNKNDKKLKKPVDTDKKEVKKPSSKTSTKPKSKPKKENDVNDDFVAEEIDSDSELTLDADVDEYDDGYLSNN